MSPLNFQVDANENTAKIIFSAFFEILKPCKFRCYTQISMLSVINEYILLCVIHADTKSKSEGQRPMKSR